MAMSVLLLLPLPPPPPPPLPDPHSDSAVQAPVLQGLGFKCGSVNIDVKAAQELVVSRW